jgi:DNA-directed RNA polymerase subunit omega
MARITVEDCLSKVRNRFQLVIIASKRASVLARNPSLATVEWGRDKPPVVALREIANNTVNEKILDADTEEAVDESYQEQKTSDE